MLDIKRLRDQKNMTQQELAAKCNVTVRTVQNWEKGKHVPESARMLLELLGFSDDEGEKITSFASGDSVSVPAAQGHRVNVEKSKGSTETDKFLSILERQQNFLLAQMKVNNKRDEQIDRLITIIERKSKEI